MILGLDLFEGFPHLQFIQELGNNSLTAGIPGIGITTQIIFYVLQTIVLGIKVLLVDPEKEELFSALQPGVEQIVEEKIHRIKLRDLPFNLFQVPNKVAPYSYVDPICEAIGSELNLLEPGKRLL